MFVILYTTAFYAFFFLFEDKKHRQNSLYVAKHLVFLFNFEFSLLFYAIQWVIYGYTN